MSTRRGANDERDFARARAAGLLLSPTLLDIEWTSPEAFDTVREAIQAAWRAEPAFAAALAREYGIYDKVCLCCVNAHLAAIDPSPRTRAALGEFAFQLCVRCMMRPGGEFQGLPESLRK